MIHDGSHKFELHSFNEKQADRLKVQTTTVYYGLARLKISPLHCERYPQAPKKITHLFWTCGSAALPAGLPRTSRAIPEINKPFATSFHEPSNYHNALTFPRREWQETCNAIDDSFKRISFFFLLRPFGTNRYFYCGRSCEGERDRAPQQYLIEPGHCMRAYFTCKSRRCRSELWEMVFPWSLIDSRNYFHQPN